MNRINYTLGIMMLAIGIISCTNEEKNTATVMVSLVDAPADYESVMIDVQAVLFNVSGEESEGGWDSLTSFTPGVYDLLELTNGEELFLGDFELGEGKIGQIRLVLGENNSLVIDGEEIDLTTPSASQSGLKLNIHDEVVAGVTYKLLIDFDAAKSVVKSGNSGKYNLKPVIRATLEAQSGTIEGVVAPADVPSVVYAIINDDTVSTYPEADGAFLIRALAAGEYTVLAVPGEESGYDDATIESVVVTTGEKTAIDTLKLIVARP